MRRRAFEIALALLWLCGRGGAARAADRLEDASWRVTPKGLEQSGIKILSGADGVTAPALRGGLPCLTTKEGATPPSSFLYFQIENRRAKDARGPVYLVVEYFDAQLGGPLELQYDSATGDTLPAKYLAADDRAGGYSLGAKKWKTAIFLLKRPRFANRENLGADFRFGGAPLFLRSLRLTHTRPGAWAQADRLDLSEVKPLVKIGAGGQFIVGGFDPARHTDAVSQSRALEASLPALKSLGVTSHEGYVRWNLCEPEKGRYDWSVYDRFVSLYKRYGLKWVPFLIVGSPYSLPDWYYKQPGAQGYVCLEHGQESDVQSLWNPVLRDHVARFLKAFCDHYRDSGVIEAILLGVTGNYGEAIYPATGNDWTADIHGPYHSHPGFWAGDKFAVASFRRWLTQKYGAAERLRAAWGPQSPDSFEKVVPFLRAQAPSDRAWLDFIAWYSGSMTDWARFWLRETRRYFPQGDIYLCTGGDATPEHGSDFAAQCKAAAEVGGGVRITNEGSDARANFALTRWVASAGRQYGAYFSFEPAGAVDENGVTARLFNATTSGARGLHYYFPNLFAAEAARQNFVRYGAQFQQRKPVLELAVYYPQTTLRLHGGTGRFLNSLMTLRDFLDFDLISDGQIADGGLKRYKGLILLDGAVAETKTWQTVVEFVRQGNLLVYPDFLGKLRTVEGDESFHTALFGPQADRGVGYVLTFVGGGTIADYGAYLTHRIVRMNKFSRATRAMLGADAQEDGVLVSVAAPNELIWLNTTAKEVRKLGKYPIVLPPHTLRIQQVDLPPDEK